ncbi:MAG: hypothetical protein EPN22_02320 [Nitrospirae bacterium]|nr:MAG: hypothetical protein EPN22_02320 [Nitrospirota bacterium]
MDKTLYLSEAKGLEVLRDGPSLWIKQENKAGRRIPARRVGRVIIIGNVRMDSGVITLFTENDIPVTLMDTKGDEVAVTVPYNHKLPRHRKEQKIYLKNEECIKKFNMWLASNRRRVQLGVIKRLSEDKLAKFCSFGFKEKEYQEFISGYKRSIETPWHSVNSLVSNIFREMILAALIKADLDPHIGVLHRRHNFSLALDICHILGPEEDLQTIQFFGGNVGKGCLDENSDGSVRSKDAIKDIVHRFENRRKTLLNMTEKIIDDLFELMRDLRYEG